MTKTLVFRSALSKTMRDGVTAPCGKSTERKIAVECTKASTRGGDATRQCLSCYDGLMGKKKGKKGAGR